MTERKFSEKCWRCHMRTVRLVTVPFNIRCSANGRSWNVNIPDLSVPMCLNCNEIIIDPVAEKRIQEEFRRVIGEWNN